MRYIDIHTKLNRTLKNGPADHFSEDHRWGDDRNLLIVAAHVFRESAKLWKRYIPMLVIVLISACTDFVDVGLPKNKLNEEDVFNEPETVEAALKSIYGKMRKLNIFIPLGLYTDELEYNGSNASLELFQTHSVLASNATVSSWWSSIYNHIYAANAVVEGVGNSTSLLLEDRDKFMGEALFIRGYSHLLLVELFGDIPYIRTTDYIENTTVSRMPQGLVYENIEEDLGLALDLLPDEDITGERIRTNKAVAEAVLARFYLYTGQWEEAKNMATIIINKFGALELDVNKVFLKEASSTIWQFKPDSEGKNSEEGSYLIFLGSPDNSPVLSSDLVNTFELGTIFQPEKRRQNWIKGVSNNTGTWYHAFKYKVRGLTFLPDGETPNSEEYSIQLRLAEQYLIRAEAWAQLGEITKAQADINMIRNRAGLPNTTANALDELLDAILQERRIELFTEWGHRWFDLKRMGKAKEVLAPLKPGWKDTDILFPIPENEIFLNPNLKQNDGYN